MGVVETLVPSTCSLVGYDTCNWEVSYPVQRTCKVRGSCSASHREQHLNKQDTAGRRRGIGHEREVGAELEQGTVAVGE